MLNIYWKFISPATGGLLQWCFVWNYACSCWDNSQTGETSKKNSLELIELSSINKVSLV
jgi:hypothetical protein